MTCVLNIIQYLSSGSDDMAIAPTELWRNFSNKQLAQTMAEYGCPYSDAVIVDMTQAHGWMRDNGTELEFESEEYLTLFCLRWA